MKNPITHCDTDIGCDNPDCERCEKSPIIASGMKVVEEEFEKEFDNRFWLHRVPKNTKQSQDIKSFIKQLLQKEREKMVEDAREFMDKVDYELFNRKVFKEDK